MVVEASFDQKSRMCLGPAHLTVVPAAERSLPLCTERGDFQATFTPGLSLEPAGADQSRRRILPARIGQG
ncbi:hypothetical protein EYF80_028807 [Liparis tanakae]|uniref:Uncharacterized protein n=1 Tax=Liparis tanakae TaxID=230148 RepID=A0A4Z2H5H5_9TELE|nr:hypothetical protein EYF80_028807 [Liparis tanakae]